MTGALGGSGTERNNPFLDPSYGVVPCTVLVDLQGVLYNYITSPEGHLRDESYDIITVAYKSLCSLFTTVS